MLVSVVRSRCVQGGVAAARSKASQFAGSVRTAPIALLEA
jgi:hypothetical protein